MSEVITNYDEFWKEALNEYFESFLSFFFPNIYSLVDWNKTTIALDKEFQQLKVDSDPDVRVADKLYKVGLLDKKLLLSQYIARFKVSMRLILIDVYSFTILKP